MNSESRRSTTGTFEQLCSHPKSVQLLAEAGLKLKLDVLTDSTANIGMHSGIGSGRVRHFDVRLLWTREAVQTGRFTLKEVGTTENVSDLAAKYRDDEILEALMRLGGLRFSRGLQHAASAAAVKAGRPR